MYKITVKGEARVHLRDHGYEGSDYSEFDGIEDDTCFYDYMREDRCSAIDVISGGYLKFKYEDDKLWSITEYDSSRILTEVEMDELRLYTIGQWSDGIGEGFEQRPCNDNGDYISPWFNGQVSTVYGNYGEIRENNINELGN